MIQDAINDLNDSIEKAHEALRRELGRLRTGRANASLLDTLRVDYYGTPTPLQQMAQVSVPEPRMLVVKPWEKDQLKAIERAIIESQLGLNPQNDGVIIRVPMPALTEERRKDLVKKVKSLGEDAKVSIRSSRREAMEHIKKAVKDGFSEDGGKMKEADVQHLTDKFTKDVDDILIAKEKDIMTV